jgi:hypothetical protein
MVGHVKLLYGVLMILLCFANHIFAKSLSINVYLKFKQQNQIYTLIDEFDQLLSKKGILSSYHIKPFISDYPIHVTLYLADYKEQELPNIIKHIKLIAKTQKPIKLTSQQLMVSHTGYVMLSLVKTSQLQQLSNQVVKTLSPFRDASATIPSWAANDIHRLQLFKTYGSPNVLEYFNPHVSLFDPTHLSERERSHLVRELREAIKVFKHRYKTTVIDKTTSIGIGIANQQGQIIHELYNFPFG